MEDPTPSEIADACRKERLQWDDEQRYLAISNAPIASVTDHADEIYLEEMAKGRYLSALDCIAIAQGKKERPTSMEEAIEEFDGFDPYAGDVEMPFSPETYVL